MRTRCPLPILAALAAALGAATAAAPAAAEGLTLTLGHAVFESHPFHDASVRFAEAVAERSGGEVTVEIFPARQMGDVKELMEGVQLGTIDMTVNSASAIADLAPAVDAFQLPYVMRTYEDFARLAVSPEAEAIMETLADDGMIGLGLYEGGQRHFLSAGPAVEDMDGFGGLKTRVAPTGLFLDVWKAAGVNPTPMAYGEIYSGLETGAIDAVEINLTSIESEGLFDAAKHVTLTGHYFWPGVLLINEGVWSGLTEERRTLLREAAREVVEPQVAAVAAYDEELKTALAGKGMTIVEASGELVRGLEGAFEDVVDKYAGADPLVADFVAAAGRDGAR